jgi:hypothetical protein
MSETALELRASSRVRESESETVFVGATLIVNETTGDGLCGEERAF